VNYRVRDEHQRQTLLEDVRGMPLPFRADLHAGEDRSLAQNRLSHLWYSEIARAGALDPQFHPTGRPTEEAAKRECKLRCGVPILRRDSEAFAEVYDRVLKPLPIEDKCAAMSLISVSSVLTVSQMAEYMNRIWDEYRTKRNVRLTEPDEPAMLRAAR